MYSTMLGSRFVCPEVLGKSLIMLRTLGPGEEERLLEGQGLAQARGPFLLLDNLRYPDPGLDSNPGDGGTNLDLQEKQPKH